MKRAKPSVIVAALAASALLVGACGSSSSPTSSGTTPTTGAATAKATGAGKTNPTGAPILIGVISEENDPAGSFPEGREAIEAVTKYFNDTQNGIGGRPIVLKECTTTSAPEASQACANQMVQDHVVAVFDPSNLGEAAEVPVIDAAQIPDFAGGETTASYKAAYYIDWSSSLYGLAAAVLAVVKTKFNATHIAFINIGNAGGIAAGKFLTAGLNKEGITVSEVDTPPTATDYTSYVSVAQSKHPQAVVVFQSKDGCLGVMKAASSLGLTVPIVGVPACMSGNALQVAGAAGDGWYSVQAGPFPTDTADPDTALFRSILTKYESTPTYGDAAPYSFSSSYTLYKDVLEVLGPSNISAASIYQKAKAITTGHIVMGTNFFACGTISVAPSICGGAGEFLYQDKNGQAVDANAGQPIGADLTPVL